MSNEFRSNIEKLNDGKIKNYMIFSQLELEVLCDYLKKNNILHKIKIEFSKPGTVVRSFLYDKYKENTIVNIKHILIILD